MKCRTVRPTKKVAEAQLEDVYETCTLASCAAFLRATDETSFLPEMLKKEEVDFVLMRAGIRPDELLIAAIAPDQLAKEAFVLANEEGKPYVTILDVFAAYLLLTEKESGLLFKKELKKNDLLTIIAWAQSIYPAELTISFPKIEPWGEGIGEGMVSGWTLETQKYTRNFTRRALNHPTVAVGREKELGLLIESLSKSKQSNVLLVGESGVGKQELVANFATKSFLGDLPAKLRYMRVLELLSGMLVAGTQSNGELEDRLQNILEEVAHAGNVVIFIPQLESIAGAGSDRLDVTGVLLPHLLDDKIHVIASITPSNYKTYVEKNTAFADAFDKITLSEPSKEEAIPILLDASLLLEKRHHALYLYNAIVTAVDLSKKYLTNSHLPGKAVALLDEVGAKISVSEKKVIEKTDIVSLIEAKVPVKVAGASKEEKKLLLHLETFLHKRIIDQQEAVTTVAEAMRRLRSGLSSEGKPVGAFLFLGPTGVGKTETAKALASVYFGSQDEMVRFDMSEYQEQNTVGRLIDTLAENITNQPFSLVLLDEFEKAYPSLLDVFLSVFEDGRLTDSQGRTVSFENAIIIATSNAGSEVIREKLLEGENLKSIRPGLLDALQKDGLFKPELLNRFDAIVLFEPLGKKEIEQITALLLQQLVALFSKKDITFTFDEKAVEKIAKEGFDQTMGARPLRRFIQDHVEDLLSKKLLQDEIARGDTVVLSTDTVGNLTLEVRNPR